MTAWDPSDDQPFSFSGTIDFEACCDALAVDGIEYTGRDAAVTGSALGPTLVRVYTDGSADSGGIRSMDVTCGSTGHGRYLTCTERGCSTRSPLPDNLTEAVVWDPCDGGGFRYSGRVDTEACCDHVIVDGDRYSGDDSFRGRADGPIRVAVETDSSIASDGIRRLIAHCD